MGGVRFAPAGCAAEWVRLVSVCRVKMGAILDEKCCIMLNSVAFAVGVIGVTGEPLERGNCSNL